MNLVSGLYCLVNKYIGIETIAKYKKNKLFLYPNKKTTDSNAK